MSGALAPDRLYAFLPAVYREQDAEAGSPLRALLGLVQAQADLLEGDIEGLWNDLFIETCRPWVVPYIGDLVANDLLSDASRTRGADRARELFPDLAGPDLRPPLAARARADVAKTIYYRRRKGTLPMLEELARDVTGWPAHAVEFFELLGWTQHPEHVRPQARWTDVRSIERMERINGAFAETSHTVDVRPLAQQEGWHAIRTVGFFLWRLRSYPLENVPARIAGAAWRYHLSPLGNPAPLFTRWRREGDETGLATELHVPGPIRRAFFADDLGRHSALPPPDSTDLYGLFEPVEGVTLAPAPEASLFVFRNEQPVAPAQILCRRLDPWPPSPPAGAVVAVDVERGRLAVGDGFGDATTRIDVSFHYGFPADLGGGPYGRRAWLVRPELATAHYRVREAGPDPEIQPPVTHTSLAAALADWDSDERPNAVVTILDSRTYPLPGALELRNEGWLVVEAADGERPLLQTAAAGLELGSEAPGPGDDPTRRGELTLNGVVVEGSLHVIGDLGRLRLLHSTLVPGRRLQDDGSPATADASLEVESTAGSNRINDHLRVEAAFSITGPLVVPARAAGVTLLDCIVDGLGGTALTGPDLTLERTTVLGSVTARTLYASESILAADVQVERTQAGCVRFSYVTPGSRTSRRYRCQPDLAAVAAVDMALGVDPTLSQAARDAIRAVTQSRVVPSFTANRYGLPGYGQLRFASPVEIRNGAEDGSEMGAFCHVKQPQRESNLRIRLNEYLPFGLEAGAIYVT